MWLWSNCSDLDYCRLCIVVAAAAVAANSVAIALAASAIAGDIETFDAAVEIERLTILIRAAKGHEVDRSLYAFALCQRYLFAMLADRHCFRCWLHSPSPHHCLLSMFLCNSSESM